MKAQGTHESFIDTLANASSMQVKKADSARSEMRQSSEKHLNSSPASAVRNSKSSTDQSQKNTKQIDQETSAQNRSQLKDSKQNQGTDEAGAAKKADRPSDKSDSRKTSPDSPAGRALALQNATLQPETVVPAQAAVSDSQALSAESTDQPEGDQSTTGISGQGFDIQGQPGVSGPSFFAVQPSTPAGQGNDTNQESGVLKADGTGAGQAEVRLVGIGQLADFKAADGGDAQSSAVNADATPAIDPASVLQASLTAMNQTEFAVRPGDGKLSQSAVKAVQSKFSGSTSGLNSSTGDSGKAARNDGSGDDHASVHVSGVESLQAQSSQTGHTGGTQADVKIGDGIAIQSFTVAEQAESRGTTGAHTSSTGSDSAVNQGRVSEGLTGEQWLGNLPAGMSGISAARLIQTMGTSEMRVGMHSAEFGDISIRTSVAQQQMQTQISVDHGELGNALANHIPNVQAKLGSEFGLHATIEVNQSGASFSSEGDRSQQQQDQAAVRRIELADGPVMTSSDVLSVASSVVSGSDSRLDIRA